MAANKASFAFESTFAACCHSCGKSIDVKDVSIDRDNDVDITIEFCDTCGQNQYDEGYTAGVDDGKSEMKEELQPKIDELENKLFEAESLIARIFRKKD